MGPRSTKVWDAMTVIGGGTYLISNVIIDFYSMCVGEKRKLVIPPQLGKFFRLKIWFVWAWSSLLTTVLYTH
jgi:hypothetical protein